MTVDVRSAPRAEAQADAADLWWRANRMAAPDLFRAELAQVLRLLSMAPEVGEPYVRRGRILIRRVLLRRSGYHVYYRFSVRRREVLVVAVWAATRGRRPPLGEK